MAGHLRKKLKEERLPWLLEFKVLVYNPSNVSLYWGSTWGVDAEINVLILGGERGAQRQTERQRETKRKRPGENES